MLVDELQCDKDSKLCEDLVYSNIRLFMAASSIVSTVNKNKRRRTAASVRVVEGLTFYMCYWKLSQKPLKGKKGKRQRQQFDNYLTSVNGTSHHHQ